MAFYTFYVGRTEEESRFLRRRRLERPKPFSSMNQTGVPICFQHTNQTLLPLPASAGAIPILYPMPQSFPYAISPALSILSNDQSTYADDQAILPIPAALSSREEVGDIINTTIANRRKRVVWTMEEHLNFLRGVELYGKGQWKMIAKLAVKTKTPSQVASHAQKYFIRQSLAPDKRKRSSIHDITIADVPPPVGHPTPFSQQQPQQHATGPTAQPPAPVESQDFPSTSSAPVPINVDQFEVLLYGPNGEGRHEVDKYFA